MESGDLMHRMLKLVDVTVTSCGSLRIAGLSVPPVGKSYIKLLVLSTNLRGKNLEFHFVKLSKTNNTT